MASGLVAGFVPASDMDDPYGTSPCALSALEAVIVPVLLRTPCLVTFSGGTDSSLVLAVATRLARRHGLADPIPVSWHFPAIPETDECDAQHRVLTALGLQERVVLTAEDDELDFVGPVAQGVLLRHGVRHPANLHLHAKPVELARGGSLLTGVGGDQLLSGWRRPENRTLLRRTKDRVPPPVRVGLKQLVRRELPWLRPAAAAAALEARMREEADEPVHLSERVRWHLARRELQLSLDNLRRLGGTHDVDVVNPIADARFVHALARELGDRPAPRRADLVRALAHDSLPAVISERRPKARFRRVFLGRHTRELTARWDGSGLDPELIDVAALRRSWSTWPIPLATAGLVQQVFVTTRAGASAGAGAS